jgi:hypothetical protein
VFERLVSASRSPGMQDRVRKIEDEFDRRFAALLEWRTDQIARASHGMCVRFPVGTNQFYIKGGMSACTATATAAALFFLTYIASKEGVVACEIIPNLPWDDIVTTGVRLWLEYAQSATGRKNSSGHVAFNQLLGCGGKFCSTTNRALKVIAEIAGHTDDGVVQAMDPEALPKTLTDTINAIPPRAAAIITATFGNIHADADVSVDSISIDGGGVGLGVTLAVLRLYGEPAEYWIYDSHGSADTGKAALLCHCTTAEAAVNVLGEQLPAGLFSATVVTR